MSTLTEVEDAVRSSSVWLRRAAVCGLTLLVAAGLLGLLGVRTAEESDEAGGYRLQVRYPVTARAGLDVVWQVRVDRAGGFGEQITLAVTGSYFEIFESQAFHPEPVSAVRDGQDLVLTFDPPPGDTFVLDYDAYVQPASQQGRDARVAVMEDGEAVASVRLTTHLVP